ncbi:glycosyltransferase family 2 protein [Microaerobacter geothermalis]|uniref:glycosyltransferase family 2 protein n=1 Tax=Microaerobacter geothermalis TaxID=674972 RepID=UPI001F2227AB|nr:glycosyltransferase family 2 protein [Microaerobacter geothermalis]MCF6095138.1 glycosyltransferase family 2 protein [Microaerobacter geothermalis]
MKKCIVVIPAHNEEKTIGKVIQKIPRDMGPNWEIRVLVVNDGSTDGTVVTAKESGADYFLHFETNKGLGAAIREGLREAYKLGANIGVMIDADDEYPADEIPKVIQPILNGEADYVMGSRFKGTIRGMKWYRRWGNYFFTGIQSLLLRQWIYDGQSGFRAFSRAALADVEICHDYNYAQVMTLNLVRKGYRMVEVPISYKVREHGESFIRFFPYVSKVFPAMMMEMRRPVREKRVYMEHKEKRYPISK